MAPTASTTISSVSSPNTHPDSDPIIYGLITRKSKNQREPSRTVRSFDRVLDEISSSLHALRSLTPGVEPEPYESRPLNGALSPPTVRRAATSGSSITPPPAKPEDNLLTYPTSNVSSQRTTDSREQFRELWYALILEGCWSNTRSDLNATRVVAYGPWADKSTPNLLARMIMTHYAYFFTDPWVFNTGTLRIIKFLESIEERLREERGMLGFFDFRASVRRSALDAFHLSIDLVAPNVLLQSCYLGALFRHGSIYEADVLCALAGIARLAKRLEYFQAFYYLLTEAGAELHSQPRVVREVRQHALVLRDTLTENDEPTCSLRWYAFIDQLIKSYESCPRPFQVQPAGVVSWFDSVA